MGSKMTYGEAICFAKDNYSIKNGIAHIKIPPHKSRMGYKQAINYYTDKLSKVWINSFKCGNKYGYRSV